MPLSPEIQIVRRMAEEALFCGDHEKKIAALGFVLTEVKASGKLLRQNYANNQSACPRRRTRPEVCRSQPLSLDNKPSLIS